MAPFTPNGLPVLISHFFAPWAPADAEAATLSASAARAFLLKAVIELLLKRMTRVQPALGAIAGHQVGQSYTPLPALVPRDGVLGFAGSQGKYIRHRSRGGLGDAPNVLELGLGAPG
ncbi:MAG TPA: hypothetical protein VNS52_18725, partial [Gemmatimonadaceae bacterium]|nr:hypothetical protein [Gemmatimonadaceae bacterium]